MLLPCVEHWVGSPNICPAASDCGNVLFDANSKLHFVGAFVTLTLLYLMTWDCLPDAAILIGSLHVDVINELSIVA